MTFRTYLRDLRQSLAVGQATRRPKTRKPRRTRVRLRVDELEDRTVPTVTLFGIPDWTAQGPGPTTGGQVNLGGGDPVSGAIEAIATHPTDANTVYVGAVNGGVWRTTNGGANWTPLTDQTASLSIADVAFSPLDATAQTLFYGVGNYSSGGGLGGARTGLFRTTDGGTSWQSLGLANERIREVIPTSIGTSLADQVVLVASRTNGLFRSSNGGGVFTQISNSSGTTDGLDNDADGTTDEVGERNLPIGDVVHLTADPGNPNRFYAALPNQGVFRSDNGGANWVLVNTATLTLSNDALDNDGDGTVDETDGSEDFRGANRIELSVSAAAGNPVYAALIGLVNNGTNNRNRLMGVFRSTDQGATWTRIGNAPNATPGGQAATHFSILADRTDPNQVYIAGDRAGGSPFVANMFLGDASDNSWTSIVNNPLASLTEGWFGAPHADSRDMAFDASGNIIEVSDGGIARMTTSVIVFFTAHSWGSMNGDIQPTEFYSVALDTVTSTIVGGTQDTGATEQQNPNDPVWSEISSQNGDGGTVDTVSFGAISQHFTMGNNLTDFVRRTFVGGVFFGEESLGLSGLVGADTTVTGLNVNPYMLNLVDPTRLAIGNVNLYESSDQGENVTQLGVGGATGVSAIAYGGRRSGANNAEVIYAGVGGNLFLRSAAGPNLTQVATYTAAAGGAPTDIALHPEDWQRAYVTDGTNVFMTTTAGVDPDGGGPLTAWTNITGNLGALTGRLQTVSVFSPTGTPGDEVVLVGGLAGVFRTRNPEAGPLARWTEFGGGLPNAVIQDVRYYGGTNDTLLVGTWGRGAWTVGDASDTLDVAGVVQIDGDTDFPGQDDVIRLQIDLNNPALLNIYVNSAIPTEVVQLSTIEQINVNGLGGNDTLIVDITNGLISVPNGIRYDGGAGFDRLDVVNAALGGGSPTGVSEFVYIGSSPSDGRHVLTTPAGTQTIDFHDLQPVTSNVAAADFTITSTPGIGTLLDTENTITYSDALLLGGGGRVTVDAFEPIEFINKQNLTIETGAAADIVDLVNTETPVALTGITVNAGSGNDTVIAAPDAETPGLEVNGGLGNDFLSADGDLNGNDGNDILIGGASDNELFGGNGEDTLDGRGGSNSLDGGADTDTILVSGTSGPDTIVTTHGGGTFNITGGLSAGNNTISGMQRVRVEAGEGADSITLNLLAAGGLNYTVLGGNPIGTTGGDSLTVSSGAAMTVTPGPENDAGSVDAATTTPTNVSFDEIEVLIISGGGGGVINGTNGNDAITVIARDASTHAGANGVQDFTAVVNAGFEILFLNQPTLTVNALGGSDTTVLRTPAPNNAVWDVDVTIDGGPPSAGDPAGSDRLVVETPGAGAETAVYTPTASDAGTLDLTSISSPITIIAIEELLYDGEADNDSFTVVGTGGADVITHTPGTTNQSGSFAVNGLLPVAYQNLGGSGSLSANGAGGGDVLVAVGTNGNDTFVVPNAAGDVLLNTRLLLATTGVETLTMEGLLGDDLFDIVPPMPSLVYDLVNANGGGHASATGDRTILHATGGADDIVVSGQVVSLAGKTVASSGVEGISLDAAGAIDTITYNGVSGAAEAIKFISAGVAGQGQISVPGVTLVTFTGVEGLNANGNTGAAGDEDTFTFTGTNAIDRIKVFLAAAGTAADPVLLLQNASGSSTLLTLLNYTNFNTLRVNALEGEDVIDAYTAGGGPSRNLFVDGGDPTGKKKSTDKLTVFYTPPRPSIIHSAETQDPDAGLVDLDYGTARFLIQYDNIEDIVIRRL